MNNVFIILISIILAVCLVILIISLVKNCKENHTNGPGSGSGGGSGGCTLGIDAQGRGTLFLYPESNGFKIPDFGGFPDAQSVKKNFHTIAVVANHAGDYVSQWNDPHVSELKKNTGLPVTKWLAYYFAKDSNWACMCNYAGCASGSMHGQSKNSAKCAKVVLAEVTKDISKYGICGIIFDDEVGNPTYIVNAFEEAKVNFPDLQLGWSKSLGSAKKNSPESLGNVDWDICFGQAYTDTTSDLYDGSCKFSKDFWENIKNRYDSTVPANRGVPMVCGSGNCQEIDGCIDERLTGSQITKLLNLRPSQLLFKWRNFAIWYGTYANPSTCNAVGKCCKNTTPDCATQCCDKWSM